MTRHLSASFLFACSTLIASVLFPGQPAIAMAQGGQAFASGDSAPDAISDDYAKGTKALDQQHWQDAITDFDRVIAAHGKRADAALYWKAYALNKLGRPGLVTGTCNQLLGTFPRSTWNRDCSTLNASRIDPGIYSRGPTGDPNRSCIGCINPKPQPNDNGIYFKNSPRIEPQADGTQELQRQLQRQFEIDRASSDARASMGSDADLKMLAMNSLLQRDPAQALPAIRNVLTENSSPELKQRAITALAMSQSPDAQALLRDVALGKVAPAEQRQAIQMLGAFQGKRAGDTLAEIYRNSNDRSIKRAALSGLFISGDAQRMVDLARNEKDLQLKHDIVAQLALMHDKAATDYMLELLK